jgi:hypothetical protein
LDVKTTVEIPDALFNEAKKYAAARGLTFREVIETGLRDVLDRDRGAQKPFRLRNHTFKGKGQLIHDWKTIRQLIHEGRGG